MTRPTLAFRFCTMDPDLAGAMADADNAKWSAAMDDSAEITFSDGSVASTLNGGPWLPVPLSATEEEANAAQAAMDAATAPAADPWRDGPLDLPAPEEPDAGPAARPWRADLTRFDLIMPLRD